MCSKWRLLRERTVYLSTTVSPLLQGQVDEMCLRFSGIKVGMDDVWWRLYETVSIYVMLSIHFWNFTISRVSCLKAMLVKVVRVVQSTKQDILASFWMRLDKLYWLYKQLHRLIYNTLHEFQVSDKLQILHNTYYIICFIMLNTYWC